MTGKTLESIIHNQAEYVRNSGFEVVVDTRLDTVSITHESGEEDMQIFLQGSDGARFIRKAKEIWEDIETITEDDSFYAEAKQYVENLS